MISTVTHSFPETRTGRVLPSSFDLVPRQPGCLTNLAYGFKWYYAQFSLPFIVLFYPDVKVCFDILKWHYARLRINGMWINEIQNNLICCIKCA